MSKETIRVRQEKQKKLGDEEKYKSYAWLRL